MWNIDWYYITNTRYIHRKKLVSYKENIERPVNSDKYNNVWKQILAVKKLVDRFVGQRIIIVDVTRV